MLYTIIHDYYGTGEGLTQQVLVISAYNKQEAINLFAKEFDYVEDEFFWAVIKENLFIAEGIAADKLDSFLSKEFIQISQSRSESIIELKFSNRVY